MNRSCARFTRRAAACAAFLRISASPGTSRSSIRPARRRSSSHSGPAAGIDKVGGGVMERRVAGRQGNKDNIGKRPRGKGAGAKAQRFCPVTSPPFQRCRSREHGRVVPEEFLEEGGELISPNRSRLLFEAQPSVRDRRSRRRCKLRVGQRPMGGKFMLLEGLWEMLTPRFASSAHSASSSQQPCAAMVRGKDATLVQQGDRRFPCCEIQSFTSFSVSARWMWMPICSSRANAATT